MFYALEVRDDGRDVSGIFEIYSPACDMVVYRSEPGYLYSWYDDSINVSNDNGDTIDEFNGLESSLTDCNIYD